MNKEREEIRLASRHLLRSPARSSSSTPADRDRLHQHTMSTNVNSMSVVVVVVLAMFISNLSSDKIAHVHIYATTILCVIFWIKSNIKMSNFLTTF